MTDNFVTFTFPTMKTAVNKSGVEKKVVKGMPSWAEITRENMENYNNERDGSTAILTGEKSGITVMDFDSQESYDTLINLYPDLQHHYTVKTPNGFHLYFKYDARINTSTEACINIPHIDIRNDNALVIAPPTKYTLKNKIIVQYVALVGDILEFPEFLKPHLKQFKPIFDKPTKKASTKPEVVPVAILVDMVPNESDRDFIDQLIDSGIISHLSTNYADWMKTGFIFKHTLGQSGLELFHKFSKLSENYDEQGTIKLWNSNQTYTGKPATLASLKKSAKEQNATTYKIIYDQCYPKEKKPSKHEQGNMDLQEAYSKKELFWKEKLDRQDIETLPDGREIPFFSGMYDGVMTDLEAVNKLLKLYPYFKYCHNILYAFNFTNGLWTNNKSIICGIITKFSEYIHLMNNIDGSWIMSEFKSYGNCFNLIEIMYSLVKTSCLDDTWMKRVQNSGLHKLLFPNGWYDFKTKIFYNKDTHVFNPDNVFFGCMPYAFESFSDEDLTYMETIKQRLFYDTLGKALGDYFILNISRGLSGECMKRMLFAIGDTNSGKGVLTAALSYALGDYAGTFNAESLALKDSSADEAAQNRWILLLFSKRIIISNEVKSTVKLNGNTIKKLVSGGDSVVGRKHCGEETECITHFMPIVFSNDMNDIVPYDTAVHDRVGCVSFNKHFVKENPSGDNELLMDMNIKTEVATKRFAQCLVGILLMVHANFVDNNRVEPYCEEAIYSKDTWIAPTTKNPMELFLQKYEFTNNEEDFINNKCIDDWHTETKDLGISSQKLRMLIKEYASKQNKVCYSKVHKIAKKGIACWHGIKTINEFEEEPK